MAESMYSGPSGWERVTADQIARVDSGRKGFEDPCIVCGGDWARCDHFSKQAAGLIKAVGKLTRAQRIWIIRRDKDGTMTSKTPAEQADELVAKANEMLAAAEKMRNSFAYTEKPDWVYGFIRVNFRGNYKTYTYVVYMPKASDKIFTTGTMPGTKEFDNWEAFVDWLRSDDVASHGNLIRLRSDTSIDSLELP